MPTGKVTFAGGVSSPTIQVPNLPGPPEGVRGSTISDQNGGGYGRPMPPSVYPSYGGVAESLAFYAAIVPEVAKANYLHPSNQGRNLLNIQKANYMPAGANHNPSRSQISEGYTNALQVFAAPSMYAQQTDSPGTRAKQPSLKFVSPFSSLPIPTRMPWDL